ncbi:hypothetical protein NIES4103_28950 [Nostoc sp. NIES-4103]|nr:hypothetical protein NIES4103_28950 [Nostoc sp. NIES-4103]
MAFHTKINQFLKIMTQSITKTQDPLTSRDRRIIATIVNQSHYPYECQPSDVITIWVNSDDVVWVKMTHGYARFNKELYDFKIHLEKIMFINQYVCQKPDSFEMRKLSALQTF